MYDFAEMDRKRPTGGGPNAGAKISQQKIDKIRWLWERGEMVSSIATQAGVSTATVNRHTRDMPRRIPKPQIDNADRNRLMRKWDENITAHQG